MRPNTTYGYAKARIRAKNPNLRIYLTHAVNYFDWAEELEALKTDLADTGREHLILNTNLLETEAIPRMIRNLKDAPFMTGAVLRLDGGYVLGGEKEDKIPEGVL